MELGSFLWVSDRSTPVDTRRLLSQRSAGCAGKSPEKRSVWAQTPTDGRMAMAQKGGSVWSVWSSTHPSCTLVVFSADIMAYMTGGFWVVNVGLQVIFAYIWIVWDVGIWYLAWTPPLLFPKGHERSQDGRTFQGIHLGFPSPNQSNQE